MRDDEYLRLYKACLAMAAQSTDAYEQARWLAMADTWLKRATKQRELSSEGVVVKREAPRRI
jgi:hypothetical protein